MTREEELAAIEAALRDPRRYTRITREQEQAYRDQYPAGMPTNQQMSYRLAAKRRAARARELGVAIRSDIA